MVQIVPVESRHAAREFLALPYVLYRNDPYWVPPLRIQQKQLFDTGRHPFYAHAEMARFLARRGGRTVGRIAAILDHNYNRFQNEPAGFFGFFESTRDQEAAGALVGAAREWLLGRGLRTVRGPMNPSANYECGLLVEGFDSSPCIMMPYNPPYYAELLEGAGLRKAKDLYAYHNTADEITVRKAERVAGRALANNVRIRSIRMEDFEAELERFARIYNSAWERNWGFVPMTRDELCFMAREIKAIVDPSLVLLGEVGEQVVGCALALPDINEALKHARGRLFPLGLLKILYHKRSIKRLRVLILGVVEECRTSGVAAGLYAVLFRNGLEGGYREGEFSWVLEDNVMMNRSMEALGARRYKTYRIYEWSG